MIDRAWKGWNWNHICKNSALAQYTELILKLYALYGLLITEDKLFSKGLIKTQGNNHFDLNIFKGKEPCNDKIIGL